MPVILTTLAATFFIQLGYFLWKLSADRQPRIGQTPIGTLIVAFATDWRWVSGLLATIAGWLLFIQATAIGEISLVQPLMSVGDLLLVLLAVLFLHERLNRREWLGLALTVIGATLLSWQAEPKPARSNDGNALIWLMLCVGIAAGLLLQWSRRKQRVEAILAIVVGLAFGAGATLTEALTAASSSASAEPGLSWPALLQPLLLLVIGANVAGLVCLQAAFQRGRASVIIPIQLAVANGLTVLAGMVVFSEHVDPLRGVSIITIIIGTALLHRPEAEIHPTATGRSIVTND